MQELAQRGYGVRAMVRYNSRGDRGKLEEVQLPGGGELEVRFGDVQDLTLLTDLVSGCDVVLHLAALITIPYSYQAPASYVSTNVVGTLNVLEACRRHAVKRLVVTSTSEVYGTARYAPIDEAHPLQAQSPYAASKIGADKLAESYFRSFDLPVVILRPFNTYGPRQSARAIIPTVLSQALAGVEEIRLGNLEPRRDLTFVEDTARAFALAAETPGIEGETIHFGQGEAVSVGDIAQKCLDVVDSRARLVSVAQRQRPENSEVELLLCDATKARQVLGWSPQVPLDEGLRRTAEYIRAHPGQYRSSEYAV